MNASPRSPVILAVTVLALFAGVAVRLSTPVAAQQDPASSSAPLSSGATLDEQLLEIARQEPAFGGMYFDRQGRMTIHVLESTLASQDGASRIAGMSVSAEAAFRGHPMMAAAATKRINVLPAQFTFPQLYGWSRVLRSEVLSLPGVAFTDISEDRNRLRVGVERAEVAAAVRARLGALGVPSNAVTIEVSRGLRPMATLRSRWRPLMGGIQINFGNFICTFGFVAVRAGVTGMVTNSHCTTHQSGNDYTIFHQPSPSRTANRIGIESRDPGFFTGGECPARRRCRYSDTAFVRLPHPSGPGVTVTRGVIAKPVALNAVTVTTGRFRITSERSVPVLNETVNKVGRTTGWSRGSIVMTCTNTNVSGTDITLLCQDIVQANVAAGDSGSPVFRITNSPRVNDVKLYGLLWGGGTLSDYGTVFAFSALGGRNIQRSSEMGTLATCASGFTC